MPLSDLSVWKIIFRGAAALLLAAHCLLFHRYRPGEFLVMSNSILAFDHPLFLVCTGFQDAPRLCSVYVKPLEACRYIIPATNIIQTRTGFGWHEGEVGVRLELGGAMDRECACEDSIAKVVV